eukprot:751137-Hanusia_phi.AAC.2
MLKTVLAASACSAAMAWAPAPASSPASLQLLAAPSASSPPPPSMYTMKLARREVKGASSLRCSEGCGRRQVVQGIGASVLSWALAPAAPSSAAVKSDVAEKIEKIPLDVLASVAGGSVNVSQALAQLACEG